MKENMLPSDKLSQTLKKLRLTLGGDVYATVIVNNKGVRIVNIWAKEAADEEPGEDFLATPKRVWKKNKNFVRLDYLG